MNGEFVHKDKDDHRMLFVTQIPQQDAYNALQHPSDGPTMRRFSGYEAPSTDL